MAIRVNYTQRGFRDKAEYDKFGGRTDDRDFVPDRLIFTTVKCKNPACLKADSSNYSIEHIESRDLESNPITCDCGGNNISIEYFKPHILPLIFIDENHRNATMYNNVFDDIRKGKKHPKFEDSVQIYKHPDYYYGADGNATYVDRGDPMMDGSIIDDDGNPVTWENYPWADVMVNREGLLSADQPDPQVLVQKQPELGPFMSQSYIENDANLAKTTNNDPIEGYTCSKLLVAAYGEASAGGAITLEKLAGWDEATSDSSRFYKVYVKAGTFWNYNDKFTAEQQKAINAWEEESVANTYPRKGKLYPPQDIILQQKISLYAYNRSTDTIPMNTSLFTGDPAVDIEILTQYDQPDPYQTGSDIILPDVPEELKTTKYFPPLPLFRDEISEAGSTNGTNPTNYSAADIVAILQEFPWIEEDGLITTKEEQEGTLFEAWSIPGYVHAQRETLDTSSPFIVRNHHMYSSVLYIITQVDMDDPIY